MDRKMTKELTRHDAQLAAQLSATASRFEKLLPMLGALGEEELASEEHNALTSELMDLANLSHGAGEGLVDLAHLLGGNDDDAKWPRDLNEPNCLGD